MSPALILVVLALVALVWLGFKYATPRASSISPDDPVWAAAIERARATLPEMRELHDSGHEVWAKHPLKTSAGTTEHVWGRVTDITTQYVRCTLETPPIDDAPPHGVESQIHVDLIEDWQAELDDGTIRGGFTTRAQAEIAKRQGERVPNHIEDMLRRMAD